MQSTENQTDIHADQVDDASALSPKRCPFCNSSGELVGSSAYGFGVRCSGCGVCFPAISPTREAALKSWDLRRGSSYWGGKATAGLSTRRKRRAARRNLRKARQALALQRSWNKTEPQMPLLKQAREAEILEAELSAAASRARLKELEPPILADPPFARLYELLRPRDAAPANPV